jgi:hypothetical protein
VLPLCTFYCTLAPHLLSFSIQTPPAFSHSALFFASFNPAKTGAVKAVAIAKTPKVMRSRFIFIATLGLEFGFNDMPLRLAEVI